MTQPIQSLDRGLFILAIIGKAQRPVSLPELTEILKIDRSSVFRLVNTLKNRGFLAKSSDSRGYVLGSSIWRLSHYVPWIQTLIEIAGKELEKIADVTGETAHIAIRDDHKTLIIDNKMSSQQIVGVIVRTGDEGLLHCTAVGKALLIDYDLAELKEIFGDTSLSSLTEKSICSLTDLAKECGKNRLLGYAVDNEEYHRGIRCVGAPIRDASGSVIAAVGISAPVERLTEKNFENTGNILIKSAKKISQELGFILDN